MHMCVCVCVCVYVCVYVCVWCVHAYVHVCESETLEGVWKTHTNTERRRRDCEWSVRRRV
jgi:hypothetical protein